MKKYIPYFVWLFAIVISISSCRKLVTDEFTDPELIPVINAFLIPGNQFELQASYTANISKTIFNYIDNANITLLVDGTIIENLSYNEEGIYSSSIDINKESIYQCEILVPGFDPIICTDTIPSVPKVYNIQHINEAGRNEEGFSYPAIKVSFANDTSNKQYYEVCLRLLKSDNNEEKAELETIIDPVLINEGLPIALFRNEIIKDTVYQLTLNYTTGIHATRDGIGYTPLYPLIVEFRHVSYAYYLYAQSVYLYENSRYPDGLGTATTAFNTYSNVEGGYGIFAGFSVFQSDTIYPNSQ